MTQVQHKINKQDLAKSFPTFISGSSWIMNQVYKPSVIIPGVTLLSGLITIARYGSSKLYFDGPFGDGVDEFIIFKVMVLTFVCTTILMSLVILIKHGLQQTFIVAAKCLLIGVISVVILGTVLTRIGYQSSCDRYPHSGTCDIERSHMEWPFII